MSRCGVAVPSGPFYPPPSPRRPHPALAPVAPAPVFVAPPAAPDPVAPVVTSGDPWSDAPLGSLVRWEPNARLAAKGRAAVEGTLARLGRGTTTRFARIEAGGEAVQVWENQGELRVIAAPAPRGPEADLRPPKPAAPLPAKTRPKGDRRVSVRPSEASPPPVFAAPSRKIDLSSTGHPALRDAARTLYKVESALPLLSGDRRFAPAVRAVAAVRAGLEAGRRPAVDHDTRMAVAGLREQATPAQSMVLSAVGWLLLGNERQFAWARNIVDELKAALDFEQRGGDWGELLSAEFNDPRYAEWFDDDPRASARPTETPREAAAAVVRLAEESERGWTWVDPASLEHERYHPSTDEGGALWYAAAGPADHADANERRLEDELFRAKAHVWGVILSRRRGAKVGAPWETTSELRKKYRDLRLFRLFRLAADSGLRDPARAAAPAVRARLLEAQAKARAEVEALEAPVARALEAAAGAIRAVAPKVREDFEAARASDKSLRVPQTADVAAAMESELLDAARRIGPGAAGRGYDGRLTTLLWVADGRWNSPHFAHTGAAYTKPLARALYDARRRVLAAVTPAVRRVLAARPRELADANNLLLHLSEPEHYDGPWGPLLTRPIGTSFEPGKLDFALRRE